MKKTIAAIAITLALAGSAFAQEPTYEQTQKWVVDKISTNAGSGDVYSTTYEQVSMDNCSLNFTKVSFLARFTTIPASTTIYAEVVPLAKIISVEIVSSNAIQHPSNKEYRVILHATDKEIKADVTDKDEQGNISSKKVWVGDKTSIVFGNHSDTDADMAARMHKALSHAVDLCKKNPPKEVF